MAQPERRSDPTQGPEKRQDGVMLDLEKLEQHMSELYLHKFVEYLKKVRGEHGRYLTLRAGDEVAIKAADDGSADALQDVIVEEDGPE
ncbi:MAG: hypothetical protein ACRDKT_14680 [Actinomycetota bacterium]